MKEQQSKFEIFLDNFDRDKAISDKISLNSGIKLYENTKIDKLTNSGVKMINSGKTGQITRQNKSEV